MDRVTTILYTLLYATEGLNGSSSQYQEVAAMIFFNICFTQRQSEYFL